MYLSIHEMDPNSPPPLRVRPKPKFVNIASEATRKRLHEERERQTRMERLQYEQEQIRLAREQREHELEATRLAALQFEWERELAIESHAIPAWKGRSHRSIELIACRVFKVSTAELHSERRNRHLVFARQFVMYWTYRLTVLSLPQIGQRMGGFDHTTVLHGKRAYPEKRALQGRTLRGLR